MRNIQETVEEWKDWLTFIGSEDSTVESYYQPLVKFFTDHRLCQTDLTDVDERMLDPYINPDTNIKASSRRLRKAGIRSFFKYCNAKGYRAGNPAMLLRVRMKGLSFNQKEAQKRIPFDLGEFNLLIEYLQQFVVSHPKQIDRLRRVSAKFWTAAAMLGYWTGLRLGDICDLEWASFQSNQLIVWTDKRDTRVALDLMSSTTGNGQIVKLLFSLKKEGQFVFPDQHKSYTVKKKQAALSKSFARWVAYAGIQRRGCFHCLRHSFVTRLQNDGIELKEISKLVGHTNVSTTEGYAHGA